MYLPSEVVRPTKASDKDGPNVVDGEGTEVVQNRTKQSN